MRSSARIPCLDDCLDEAGKALAGHAGNGQHFSANVFFQSESNCLPIREVRLADRDYFRLVDEASAVESQLVADHVVILHGIAAVGRQGLDEMDEDARALDVAKELMTQSDAVVRAFDQAR